MTNELDPRPFQTCTIDSSILISLGKLKLTFLFSLDVYIILAIDGKNIFYINEIKYFIKHAFIELIFLYIPSRSFD